MTHYTITNALGTGNDAIWNAIINRRGGLKHCNFETADVDTFIGEVPAHSLPAIRNDLSHFDCRNNQLAQLALETDDFANHVRTAIARYGASRIGLFLGTSTSGSFSTELAYRKRDATTGGLPADFHYAGTQNKFSLAAFVCAYFGLRGIAFVVSSACSSSAKVFGSAERMIAAGMCDAAIVGGVDSLCLTTLYGFHSLGLVSSKPCRPYDKERDGISIAEAAGFALLEKRTADAAGIDVLGVGESSDAYHMSTPHPGGRGAQKAMTQALKNAALTPKDIGYINLHGTATRNNDSAEGVAVSAVFGRTIPMSSTKGFTGHTLGAAGITEIAIAAMVLERHMIPGSLNTANLDSDIAINYQFENSAAEIKYAMSNSFGFGGSNCSIILGRCT
ncbi:beta-ketoacyl-[acyl-carrier-protein] synthase family protein [Nostoc sp.]|uniref:beta-ketoacyl-[acyl-carrier-protein] synthase family protein n=1 Tax=Nostoc sp. TaxID=1180 RepID=UPI002FF4E828